MLIKESENRKSVKIQLLIQSIRLRILSNNVITVHNAVMEDLTKINLSLAEKTRVVLDLNKSSTYQEWYGHKGEAITKSQIHHNKKHEIYPLPSTFRKLILEPKDLLQITYIHIIKF